MIDFMEEPLIKALLDETMTFSDVMSAFDIQTHVAFSLTSGTKAFVYYSSAANKYLLILNGNINYKTQCQVFVHEIAHIVRHMPKESYYVGIDQQYLRIEEEADAYFLK